MCVRVLSRPTWTFWFHHFWRFVYNFLFFEIWLWRQIAKKQIEKGALFIVKYKYWEQELRKNVPIMSIEIQVFTIKVAWSCQGNRIFLQFFAQKVIIVAMTTDIIRIVFPILFLPKIFCWILWFNWICH